MSNDKHRIHSDCIHFIAAMLLFCLHTFGQTAWCQPRSSELEQRAVNGLQATYTISGRVSQQIDEDILFVGVFSENRQNWSRDSRLPSQPFSARWEGRLNIAEAGRYRFFVFSAGRVSLRLAGNTILDASTSTKQWHETEELNLARGPVDIQVDYQSLADEASIGLYWSSNLFQREPIETGLLSCDMDTASSVDLSLGRSLSRALRCQGCHQYDSEAQEPLSAPSLKNVKDNYHLQWLEGLLQAGPPESDYQPLDRRRMPYFGLNQQDASAVVAALLSDSSTDPAGSSSDRVTAESWISELIKQDKKRKSKDPPVRTQPDATLGLQTFVSQGCIACHRHGELGYGDSIRDDADHWKSQLFAGGDLANVSLKRPDEAIARWLQDPASVNSNHRMPKFDLSLHEKLDLYAWLTSASDSDDADQTKRQDDSNESARKLEGSNRHSKNTNRNEDPVESTKLIERGRELIAKHQCGACHELPGELNLKLSKIRLSANSKWGEGCTQSVSYSNRPCYKLSQKQDLALKQFLLLNNSAMESNRPEQILIEHNCIGCHRRGVEPGIFKHFIDISENFPELASLLPGINPPALNGIGDKLHRPAIEQALGPQPMRLRDWLAIRMPQFSLKPDQIKTLTDHFISHDRIPELVDVAITSEDKVDQAYWLAAGRLVTPDGFSCQSCHQIADNKPAGIALNAHGTNLTMIGKRVREPWFYRWVKNPARIVPRMEMPAIQSAVHGILNDSLDQQLNALWLTLNKPDFKPPKPNPVRVVRNFNDGQSERTHVLTDVIETPEVVLRPLIFGFPNRQNWMLDLANGSLRGWWLGDVARQHTRGKSWYWEPGSARLVDREFLESWLIRETSGATQVPTPRANNQFALELDSLQHTIDGIEWNGRLHFADQAKTSRQTLRVKQIWKWIDDLRCQVSVEVTGLSVGQSLVIGIPEIQGSSIAVASSPGSANLHRWQFEFPGGHIFEYESTVEPERINGGTSIALPLSSENDGQKAGLIAFTRTMRSKIPADRFDRVQVPTSPRKPKELDCVPGYEAIELPLPKTEMPIALAWDHHARGFVGSLKGRVLEMIDTDADGLPDDYLLVSDELPTPYGLVASDQGLDVLAKFGLLRLTPSSSGSSIMDIRVIADGWGYTADYHDWAVGLQRDTSGCYYIALPCQQDERSPEGAYLRGHALKLTPKDSSDAKTGEKTGSEVGSATRLGSTDRLYRVESIAAGLRFPMGVALNDQGDLFTSDNQGNYTPFNELNHIRPGKRYGFINKLENKSGFSPPFESPAINIPHPWTRSVNGICFLDSKRVAGNQQNSKLFGPFEGHLIGCEMNGRCLVRMSLQKVNDQYQGAVYPFSLPVGASQSNFEGPIVCQIAPSGEIYIGNLHDSGWGGGNNTGSIVKLRFTGTLPVGIAEVRAVREGLEVEFTQRVDRSLAVNKQNYAIRSYIRTATPAYGGEDQDERTENIQAIDLDVDQKMVRLQLKQLRVGAVYELNIRDIGEQGKVLFPNQAHYTMRSIPQ